jgi:hypothetical protein
MANTPNNPQRNVGDFGSTTSRFSPGTSQGQQAGGTTMQGVKESASTAVEKARDTMSSVTERAGDLASNLGQKAQDAASAVADTWESGRRYVTEHGVSGMAEDAATLIRRNPIPALLIGFGLGFLLARSMRD